MAAPLNQFLLRLVGVQLLCRIHHARGLFRIRFLLLHCKGVAETGRGHFAAIERKDAFRWTAACPLLGTKIRN